jgi:YD repeat-containing protein
MISGAMNLYVNGVAGTSATNPTPWTGSEFHFGGLGYIPGPEYLSGALDNVQVYQRALSPADVATLYQGGNGRNSSAYPANRLTTSYVVDQRGLTTAATDPRGNTTTYEYDAAGQLVKSTSPTVDAEEFSGPGALPAVAVTRYGYNTFGDLVETKDPLGNMVLVRA